MLSFISFGHDKNTLKSRTYTFEKLKNFLLAALTVQTLKSPKMEIHIGNLVEVPSVYYFVEQSRAERPKGPRSSIYTLEKSNRKISRRQPGRKMTFQID